MIFKNDPSFSTTIQITLSLSHSNQQTFEVLSSTSLHDAAIHYLKTIGYHHPLVHLNALIAVLHETSSSLSNLDVSVGSLAANFRLSVDCWLTTD